MPFTRITTDAVDTNTPITVNRDVIYEIGGEEVINTVDTNTIITMDGECICEISAGRIEEKTEKEERKFKVGYFVKSKDSDHSSIYKILEIDNSWLSVLELKDIKDGRTFRTFSYHYYIVSNINCPSIVIE